MERINWISKVIVEEDEACANCGTGLLLHLKENGHKKVFILDSDEVLCSYKCMIEHSKPSYQVFNNSILKEADNA